MNKTDNIQSYKWWKAAVIASLILSLFCAATLRLIYNVNRSLVKIRDTSLDQLLAMLQNNKSIESYFDVISYAHEIGRLDLISLLLAFLGIVIVVFTIVFSIYIKSDARNSAKEEARKEIQESLNDIIREEVNSYEIKNLIDDAVRKRVDEVDVKDAISSQIESFIDKNDGNKIAEEFKDE